MNTCLCDRDRARSLGYHLRPKKPVIISYLAFHATCVGQRISRSLRDKYNKHGYLPFRREAEQSTV